MARHRKTANGWFSAAAAVFVARITSLVAAAVQLPILTRVLEPEEYASIAIAMVLGTYFSLFGAEATILPFQRFPGSQTEKANYRFASQRLTMVLLPLAVAVCLGGWPFGGFEIMFGVAGWGLGIAANRFIATVWLMWESPWSYAASLMMGTGLRTITVVALVLMDVNGAIAVGTAGLASVVGAVVLAPRLAYRSVKQKRPWGLVMGVSLALGSLAFTIMSNFGLLILPAMVGPDQVGQYAAMAQLVTLSIGAVLGLGSTVLYPRLQKLWNSGREELTRSFISLLGIVTVLIGGFAVLAVQLSGVDLLNLVLGNDYVVLPVLLSLIAATAASQIGQFVSWVHTLTLQSQRIRRSALLATLIGCLLTVLLTQAYGISGAATGTLMSFSLYGLLMFRASALGRRPVIALLAFVLVVAVGPLLNSAAHMILCSLAIVIALDQCLREWRTVARLR